MRSSSTGEIRGSSSCGWPNAVDFGNKIPCSQLAKTGAPLIQLRERIGNKEKPSASNDTRSGLRPPRELRHFAFPMERGAS